MAVLAVVSEQKGSMDVLYLNEDIWVDSNCYTFHMLTPLVFRVEKPLKEFSIILHGKPIDIRKFSLFKKNLENPKTVLIFSDLFKNRAYHKTLGWEKGIEPSNGNLDIEFTKNVRGLYTKDIDEVQWERDDLKECSILRILFKEELEKGNYYLAIGVYLAAPKPHNNIIKDIFSVGNYFKSATECSIHYYTFRGVSEYDRRKIRQGLYHERFAPVCTRITENGISNVTSTIFVYTSNNKLFGIIPIQYKLIEPRSLAKEPFDKDKMPLSTDELLPYWRGYKWDNSTNSLCYKIDNVKHRKYEKDGTVVKVSEEYILPSFDPNEKEKNERHPIKISIEKYNPHRMALRFALFFGIFSFLTCGRYVIDNNKAGFIAVICAIILVELFKMKRKIE